MALFAKSSSEVIIHHPGGSDWDVYSSSASIYFCNMVVTIDLADGPKALKLKSFHTKKMGETYFLLSTKEDTDQEKAADDPAIVSKDLEEDEYRACLYAMKMQDADNLVYEEWLYKPGTNGYNGMRWITHSRSSEGRFFKFIFDEAKVPTINNVQCNMWGQDNSALNGGPFVIEFEGFTAQTAKASNAYAGNYVGKATLNVPKKANVLWKKEDGSLWTIGLNNHVPGNVVVTNENQVISSEKIFTKPPKITASATEPEHAVNRAYLDSIISAKEPFNCSVTVHAAASGANAWVVMSNLEIHLTNGKKLKCLHVDNTQPTSATEPVKCVFGLIDEATAIDAAPEKQASAFFTSYKLKENELWGSVTYGKLLDKQWTEYASYSAPFFSAQYGAQGAGTDLKPMLRIGIEQAPAAVKKIKLTWDGSYLPAKAQASLDGCGLPVSSKLYESVTAGEMEIPFDLVKLTGLVTLDSEQTITALKNFTVLPKTPALPNHYAEFVTKSYVDSLVTGAQAIRIYLASDGTGTPTNHKFYGYHQIKFALSNGKHLVPVHVDQTYAADAKSSVQCIMQISDTEYVHKSVQKHEPSWFDTYNLKDNEIKGRITYAKQLDPSINITDHSYHTQDQPFDNYLVKDPSADKELSPGVMFEFFGLKFPVKTVSLLAGDEHNNGNYYPNKIKFETLYGLKNYVSKVYTSKDDNIAENTPISVTFDALDGGLDAVEYVTLKTDQTITGLKTFTALPQSEKTPTDAKDLATKKYVDEKVAAGGGGGGSAQAPTNMVTTDTEQSITAVKTFAKLPKSTAVPADNAELVNKKYVDDKVAAGGGTENTLTTISFYLEPVAAQQDTGIMKQNLFAADGKILAPVFKEKGSFNSATKPLRYVVKFIDSGQTLTAQEKDESFFGTYQLQSGEYFATIVPPHLCSQGFKTRGSDPFGYFDFVAVTTPISLWKFLELRIEKCPVEFAKFDYSIWKDLNKFQVTVSTGSKYFNSKVYSKAEDSLAQNGTYSIPFDFSKASYVTLETQQTITGQKHFEKLPQSSVIPADSKDFVTKGYVDSKTDKLKGYTISIFGKPGQTSRAFGVTKVRLFFANGARLFPRWVAQNVNPQSDSETRYIWSLENHSPTYEDVAAQGKDPTELSRYKLAASEFDGKMFFPKSLGSKFNVVDNQFLLGGSFHATITGDDLTTEQPVVKFEVLGSLPPITKIELMTDHEATYQGAAVRAEVGVIGDKPKSSLEVAITGIDQKIELTFEDAYVPDPYYVNRFDNQDVHGVKTFKTVPSIDKPVENYSFGPAKAPAIFGDLSASIAQPKAKEQILDIGITSHQDKTHQGGGVWVYTFTIDVKVGGLSLKVRRPDTLEEEELYLKACASTSDMGYVGILTNQKPDGHPNHTIEEMDASAFARYTLRDGEYLAKCYFATVSKGSISEEALKSAKQSGSQRIKDLFQPYKDSSWYSSKSSPSRFPQSSEGPSALVQLAIFNAPMISSWTVSNNSTERYTDYVYICGEEKAYGYSGGQHLTANWARDVPDVQLQTVNVLGVVVDLKKKLADLEKKNTTLEEKVKKLEEAAPKP